MGFFFRLLSLRLKLQYLTRDSQRHCRLISSHIWQTKRRLTLLQFARLILFDSTSVKIESSIVYSIWSKVLKRLFSKMIRTQLRLSKHLRTRRLIQRSFLDRGYSVKVVVGKRMRDVDRLYCPRQLRARVNFSRVADSRWTDVYL